MNDAAPRPWLLGGLCVLVVACVYVRVLGGPFVWDDRLLTDAQSLRGFNVAQAFTHPFWLGSLGAGSSAAYYRPLTALSLALDYRLHADNAAGYHLTNLLLHLLSSGLLFALSRRRGAGASLAFLLALTWALLPRLTEGAAWISGRGDVLSTALSLGALWVYRPGSLQRLALAALLGLLALFAKESGLAVLLCLGLLELGGNVPSAMRLKRGVPLVGALVLYAALRVVAGATSLGDGARLTPLQRLLTVVESLGRYVFMLLDPLQPRSLLGQVWRVSWPFVGLGVLLLGAAVLAALRAPRPTRETGAYLVLGLVPLALVLHLTPLPVSVVAADRYLYLPCAALLLAAAPALQRLAAQRRAVPALVLGLAAACGVRTFQRVGDYTDEARFWTEAVQGAPDDPTALVELGSVAYRAGLFGAALRLYQSAIPLDALSGQALDNAALVAAVSGQRTLAASLGEQLLERFPGRPAFELRRASVALTAADFDTAERHARQALRLSPALQPALDLLEAVRRARVAAARAPLSDEQALLLDIEARRVPAIEARLERWLVSPSADPRVLRRAVVFVVAQAEPERARALLERYLRRSDAVQPEPLVEALGLRLADAARVRAALSRLQ